MLVSPAAKRVAGTFAATTLTTDLLLADGVTRIVHVEYESGMRAPITARMLIYRGLIMRQHPSCTVHQYVVFLGDGQVPKVRGWPWPVPFTAIYLRELDHERFLHEPALAPLAVLARGSRQDRRYVFARALEIIRSRGGDRVSELLEQASVLATIRLDRPTINQIIQEAGMTVESIVEFYRETVIGQALRDSGREEGLEAAMSALLHARFDDDPRIPAIAARLAVLTPDEAVREVTVARSLDDLSEPRQT